MVQLEHTPRHVLVTGASGLIGSETVRQLTRSGVRVTALALDYPRPSEAEIQLVGSTTDVDDVAGALDGVDTVVHLAAMVTRTGTPYDQYRANVLSTFNVLSQAAERGVTRAVIASSINATGLPMNPHQVTPSHFPLDLDIPFDLADAYSLSKQSDELTAGMVNRAWGMNIFAYRFPKVARTDEEIHEYARFAADAGSPKSRAMREGWSYLFVEDAARAIILGLKAPFAGVQPLYVVAPRSFSPEPTEQLLDREVPEVPRLQRFEGREVPVDYRTAQRLIGFTASRLLADA